MALKNHYSCVAIMGATGAVGQELIMSLIKMAPDVDLYLAASAKSGVIDYEKAINYWTQDEAIPLKIAKMKVESIETPFEASWVFSALPSDLAVLWEPVWKAQGKRVISMASVHRMDEKVAMVVRDVNEDHLALAFEEISRAKGVVICKPNCAAAILATFLKPLLGLGLKRVSVTSLQSLSGAGFPGLSAWQMASDFIGWIEGEADKIEKEMPKLLGVWNEKEKKIDKNDSIQWLVTCMRVPVVRGHSLQLDLEFENELLDQDLLRALDRKHITFVSDFNQLTPKKVMAKQLPMQIFWGNYKKRSGSHHQMLVIGDNLGRGAAVGAVSIWNYLRSLL